MVWILALCAIKKEGVGRSLSALNPLEKGKSVMCDVENPFFQIILNKVLNNNGRYLLMCKSYKKQEIQRSGSGILKFFIRTTFNITKVCVICHLTLSGATSPTSPSLIDIV